VKNYYVPLLAALDHAVDEGFIFREHRDALYCDAEPQKTAGCNERTQASARGGQALDEAGMNYFGKFPQRPVRIDQTLQFAIRDRHGLRA